MKRLPSKEKTEYVTPASIRNLFNKSQYPSMISSGKLIPHYLRNEPLKEPAKRQYPEPDGTRSQVIRYYDSDGKWVVTIHQYLRPDGTIGATGKPDPKRLRIGDKIFIVKNE